MTKKNRKRNRKKKQLLSGGQESFPSRCPVCSCKTILRVSRRTGQKFVGCLGFPGCNWSYNLNTVIVVPKYIPPSLPKAEVGEMEVYYHELQLLCDVGNEEARDEMDRLEKRFGVVYA
jgi:ssDNA-binding Zn-finger/Zn-ribbon topoisomerase 1